MRTSTILFTGLGMLALASTTTAGGGELKDNDRTVAEAHDWIYRDLALGVSEAKQTGKPLMVVVRCVP